MQCHFFLYCRQGLAIGLALAVRGACADGGPKIKGLRLRQQATRAAAPLRLVGQPGHRLRSVPVS